jgi:FdhD protein
MSGARLYTSIAREGTRDHVAIEEPLEIRVRGEALAVTMRSPGHNEELALGLPFGEALSDGCQVAP